jgi:Sugar phosphate permease
MENETIESAGVRPAGVTRARGLSSQGGIRWAVIGIIVLLEGSYILNSMDRNLFPILVPDIKGEFGFALGEVGLLASIFTLGVGLGGIPAAYLIDRYSTKAIVLASIFVFSATTALQTVAAGFLDMAVYRVLSGVGEGVQVAVLFAALAVLFRQRRTLALGTLNFCFGVGGFLGPLVGGYILAGTHSWRVPMWVFASAAIVFIVALWLLMPADFGQPPAAKVASSTKVARLAPERFMSRNVCILLGVAVISGFYLFSFVSLFAAYLRGTLGYEPGQAGLASGMFGVGALMGIPAGWLGDRFNQKAVLVWALLGCILVGTVAFSVDAGLGGEMAIAFFAGTFSSGFLFTNTQALLQRSMPLSRTGLASGMFVSFWFIPASVSGLAFGNLQQALGWPMASWIIMVALPVVAVIGLVFFDHRKAMSDKLPLDQVLVAE